MPDGRLVYIALGSNLGDRAAMLARGIEALNAAGVRVLRQSSLYATEPVDAPPQAWFLNAVVEAETAAHAAPTASHARWESSGSGPARTHRSRPAHAGPGYSVLRLERDPRAGAGGAASAAWSAALRAGAARGARAGLAPSGLAQNREPNCSRRRRTRASVQRWRAAAQSRHEALAVSSALRKSFMFFFLRRVSSCCCFCCRSYSVISSSVVEE